MQNAVKLVQLDTIGAFARVERGDEQTFVHHDTVVYLIGLDNNVNCIYKKSVMDDTFESSCVAGRLRCNSMFRPELNIPSQQDSPHGRLLTCGHNSSFS